MQVPKTTVFIILGTLLYFMTHFGSFVFADTVIQYDSGGRRNPFLSLIDAGRAQIADEVVRDSADFIVEGIIFDPKGGSIALVDGEYYREGDSIQKAVVISILKDRVIVQQNENEEKTFWIREEILDAGLFKPITLEDIENENKSSDK